MRHKNRIGNDEWSKQWEVVIHHGGKHYDLPGGSVGRKYVDLLTEDVAHLAMGNYTSDCVIAFCAVMLHVTK